MPEQNEAIMTTTETDIATEIQQTITTDMLLELVGSRTISKDIQYLCKAELRVRLGSTDIKKAVDATLLAMLYHPQIRDSFGASVSCDIKEMLETLASTAFKLGAKEQVRSVLNRLQERLETDRVDRNGEYNSGYNDGLNMGAAEISAELETT
jgi:hypothetical protein